MTVDVANALLAQLNRDEVGTGSLWGLLPWRTIVVLRLARPVLSADIGPGHPAFDAAIALYEACGPGGRAGDVGGGGPRG